MLCKIQIFKLLKMLVSSKNVKTEHLLTLRTSKKFYTLKIFYGITLSSISTELGAVRSGTLVKGGDGSESLNFTAGQ